MSGEKPRRDRAQPSGSCSPRARRHLGAATTQPLGALPGSHLGGEALCQAAAGAEGLG